jgi:hypothetical protein
MGGPPHHPDSSSTAHEAAKDGFTIDFSPDMFIWNHNLIADAMKQVDPAWLTPIIYGYYEEARLCWFRLFSLSQVALCLGEY